MPGTNADDSNPPLWCKGNPGVMLADSVQFFYAPDHWRSKKGGYSKGICDDRKKHAYAKRQ
jgi:hypothetical protein